MHKNKCYNGGKQHNFEARYTKFLPEIQGLESATVAGIEALKNHRYIYDICVWCGKIVKRDEQNDQTSK